MKYSTFTCGESDERRTYGVLWWGDTGMKLGLDILENTGFTYCSLYLQSSMYSMYAYSYTLLHSLTHTRSLIPLVTLSLAHSFTHSVAYLLTHIPLKFSRSCTHTVAHSLSHFLWGGSVWHVHVPFRHKVYDTILHVGFPSCPLRPPTCRGKKNLVVFGSGSRVIHFGKINVLFPQAKKDTHG